MSVTPKVSVVICGYNQAAFVEHAVESALAQTYPNVEVVAVDNGSTDNSAARLRRFESDPRVRLLLHAANGPVTKRLNEAIACTSGDYISILYADDYYLPEKLERQVQIFATLPPDYGVVYGPGYREDVATGARWLDRTLKRSGFVLRDMFLHAHSEGFINPIAPLMRRACFERFPFYEGVFCEGETIFFRFAVGFKFHYFDEPLSVMREHTSNIGKAIKINTEIALVLFNLLLQEEGFPPELVADAHTYRANLMGSVGWLAIRMAADPQWARACLLSAIQERPRHLFRARTLAGLALSSLPAAGVRAFNKAVNSIRPHSETIAIRADYS